MYLANVAHPNTEHGPSDHGALLLSIVASEGSVAHPWLHSAALNAGADATRNLADLLYLLTLLHGTAPGLVETGAFQNVWSGADGWLAACTEGFAAERDMLAELTVAAGPSPSTAGEPSTVAAVLAQRHALDTIARSDRFGCAIGAIAALTLDWMPLRATLDTAAARLGLSLRPTRLPDEEEPARCWSRCPIGLGSIERWRSARVSCSSTIIACGICWRRAPAPARASFRQSRARSCDRARSRGAGFRYR